MVSQERALLEATILVTHKIAQTLRTAAITRSTGVFPINMTDVITLTSHSVQIEVRTSGVTTVQISTTSETLTYIESKPAPTTGPSHDAGSRVVTTVVRLPATLTTNSREI